MEAKKEGLEKMWMDENHQVWHWAIKLVLLLVVFWMGVKVGEFKEVLKYEYGYYMMSGYRGGYLMGPWMMGGGRWYYQQSATDTLKY